MKKRFYTDLIDINSLIVELNQLDLAHEHRLELSQLIETTLHNKIMEAVLSELPEEDKHIFIAHLKNDDHEKVWMHLNSKVEKIEDKIKKTADELITELHKDIREAKRS